jgi:anti-sigma-K factor RskA
MNCNELRDYYELYAIGVAEDPERGEIRAHLNRECEVCMQGIKQAREVATLLGGAAEASEPSPRLRRRILASVGVEEKRFGWTPWLAAALALSMFAVVYFVGQTGGTLQELARAREQMRRQQIELAHMNDMLAILNGADTRMVTFGEGQTQPPKGKVFVNKARGVLLIANNLPKPPTGKAYEMWIIPKGGNPIPAGMFMSDETGSAMHMQRAPLDPNANLVAVTLEPEAGSQQPTSTPLFAAPIGL